MGEAPAEGIFDRLFFQFSRIGQRNAIGRRPAWLYRLLRLFKPKRLYLDGFELVAWGSSMPKQIAALLARGDYEEPERQALAALLRPGDRVLEIGGCIGVLSLMAARIVGPENVLVYEPNPHAAAVARRNFERNGKPIRLVERAVADADRTATLNIGSDSWLGASLYQDYGAQEASVVVEDIAGIVTRERPTALILDAEGAEVAIVTRCPLEGLRLVILELHPELIGEAGVKSVQSTLAAAGLVRVERFCQAQTEAWSRDPR